MKELDVLLERWLGECHAGASSEQRAAFERFLDLPDPDMARYLLGHEEPPAEHRAMRDELVGLARPLAADDHPARTPQAARNPPDNQR
jgi:succinate dehydrogenase flavin-adding protein (antitoxin of CptAB toxin-antitoxin module)